MLSGGDPKTDTTVQLMSFGHIGNILNLPFSTKRFLQQSKVNCHFYQRCHCMQSEQVLGCWYHAKSVYSLVACSSNGWLRQASQLLLLGRAIREATLKMCIVSLKCHTITHVWSYNTPQWTSQGLWYHNKSQDHQHWQDLLLKHVVNMWYKENPTCNST